jgi:hypothetical protein
MLQYWHRLDEQIRSGLAIALLAALYASVGYSGWLGDTWRTEGHDKIALVMLLFGIGFVALALLKVRAEQSGTRAAFQIYKAALFGAGTVGAVFGIAVIVAAAVIISFVTLLVATPWTSANTELFDFSSSAVYVGAGAYCCLLVMAVGGEWLWRRGHSDGTDWPQIALEAALLVFIFCLALIALSSALAFLVAVSRDVSGLLPRPLQGIVSWLRASMNGKWLLPFAVGLGAITLIVQAGRRRDTLLRSRTQQWTHILIVATALGGCLNLVTFIATVIVHNTVLR